MPDNSDNEFENYLRDRDGEGNPFFAMVTVREKFRSIAHIYKTSMEGYLKTTNSEMQKKLEDFLQVLMKATQSSIDQMDVLFGDEIDKLSSEVEFEDEDDEEEDLPL